MCTEEIKKEIAASFLEMFLYERQCEMSKGDESLYNKIIKNSGILRGYIEEFETIAKLESRYTKQEKRT